MTVAIVKCAVIGAGTMGSGIAFVAATAGIEAFQVDVKQEQLDRAGVPERHSPVIPIRLGVAASLHAVVEPRMGTIDQSEQIPDAQSSQLI